MKTLITTLAIIVSIALSNAQSETAVVDDSEGITITVTIPVNSDKGTLVGGLFNENTFMKGAPIAGTKSEIRDGIATLVFHNVVPGDYGITVLHDLNGNGQMDFELSGMPKEDYGVSNNVMNFGPPKWTDAKFTVGNEAIEMEIRL